MRMDKLVRVSRDCEALQIPSATPVSVKEGQYVRIMQALGGTYTVMSDDGALIRIDGKDADAIGEKMEASAVAELSKDATLEERVWAQLKTCYDPEIPVNIVDLGLVYECRLASGDQGSVAQIKFTLTAPGCGMGDVLKSDVESKVRALPGIQSVEVEIIFDPPWDRSMMSEAAKLQLGMY